MGECVFSFSKMNTACVPVGVNVKTKVVGGWLDVAVVAVGICVVGVGTWHWYELL